jgi:hypothetical protein
MRHIIYCVLLVATWLCSTASVIWVLNFGDLKWILLAGGCVASFISSVALAEEFFEWHRHSEASPVQKTIAAACLLRGSCFCRWTSFSFG